MLRDTALVAIVSLMFLAGLRAAPGSILGTLRDTSLIVRALVANVIIVPILAVALVRAFSLSQPIAIGIMLMALAPGIPFVIVSAGAKKGGSDAFALSLSFILPAVSVITLPFWATLLAPAIGGLHVPVGRSVVTILLAQLVPLFAGLLIGRRSERLRIALLRPVGIVSGLALVVLVVLIAVPGAKALATVFGTRAIVAILSLQVLSLATGWYLGGPRPETRRTLAVATSLRNVGLAATLATTFFAGIDVMATVVAFLIIQLIVAVLAGAYFSRTAIPIPSAVTPAH
jgi:bile acid:Na+ symporter, BASS family